MGENPYSNQTYDCTETGAKSTLATCNNFYGYFDTGKMYKLKSGSTSDYLIDTITLNLAPKNGTGIGKGLSGNYLNYVNMRKVDIIRKILVGGQVDSSVGSARGSATGGTNTRWLITDGNKRVEYGTSDPTGIVQTVYDKVRFGLMVFNDNNGDKGGDDGGNIPVPLGSSLATLVSAIENNSTDPGGYTPLAESLYEAMRYYQGATSAYNSGVNYGNTTNFPITSPFSRHAIQASCQKHFILVLTDGEPTNDGNIPGNGSSTDITDTNFSNWWTGVSGTSTGTPSARVKPATLMGRVGYYAHTHDMLDLTKTPTDISSINNITVFTVFTFDSAANGVDTLQETARFGSFTETVTAHNAKPDISTEFSTDGGTTINNYYQASDGTVLEDNITSALSRIISSTASGTAAAVANNKSGERGANMIQALFYPQWPADNTIKWLGEVQALWYYLDPIINYSGIYEDSNADKKLDLMVDGLPPSDPFQTKSLWRAGKQLQVTNSADRKIYTLIDSGSILSSDSNKYVSGNLTNTSPTLKSLMNVSTLTDSQAGVLLNYIRGTDDPLYRPRVVEFIDPSWPSGTALATTKTTGVWKLGDIINSTPQVQSSVALNAYQNAYADSSYADFIKTAAYKARNVVYTGSNDGTFHAFKLGTVSKLSDATNPFLIAEMKNEDTRTPNPDIGSEEWAYIPKNALPYLQNQAGTNYCHQNLIDGAPVVVDASINQYSNCKLPDGTTAATNYWDCERKVDSWKTVVVGSMGLGGASRDAGGSCNETFGPDAISSNNPDCVKSPITGVGLSSYFALDVTDPITPKYLWEFSDTQIAANADKGLGFTTPGPAIIRVNAVDLSNRPGKKRNGRWFAVFASGPTGAINSSDLSFTGHSDQNLKIFIVDLNATMPFTKGTNYWVKDTGIPYAFANSLNGAAIDLDRWNSLKDGNYSDDVVYITYTKASLTANANPAGNFPSSATAWDKGGIIRLVTNHNPDPSTWFLASLIGSQNNIGPITTSVGRIQDRANKKLWVYFGEGRYFFPGDEMSTQRKFFGAADPCYNQYTDSTSTYSQHATDNYSNYALGTTASSCPEIVLGDLQDQTASSGTPAVTLDAGKKGWFVNMAAASGSIGAERVVSDVTAAFNGTIFYTTFIPNLSDVCQPGGSTSMWAVKYDTGGIPASDALVGKAPVQTSSGGVKLIDLATSFTQASGRKLTGSLSPMGMAPKGKFPPLLAPKAIKQILNIQER
jgi:type IV pilus assembly protein PilY1